VLALFCLVSLYHTRSRYTSILTLYTFQRFEALGLPLPGSRRPPPLACRLRSAARWLALAPGLCLFPSLGTPPQPSACAELASPPRLALAALFARCARTAPLELRSPSLPRAFAAEATGRLSHVSRYWGIPLPLPLARARALALDMARALDRDMGEGEERRAQPA
jgi:hypothetical protein